MKELWIVIAISAICIFSLMACSPEPASPTSIEAQMNAEHLTVSGGCMENGVCCYKGGDYYTLSCVATRIVIDVSPGEVKDDTERSPAYGGEVHRPALERRIPFGADRPTIGGN